MTHPFRMVIFVLVLVTYGYPCLCPDDGIKLKSDSFNIKFVGKLIGIEEKIDAVDLSNIGLSMKSEYRYKRLTFEVIQHYKEGMDDSLVVVSVNPLMKTSCDLEGPVYKLGAIYSVLGFELKTDDKTQKKEYYVTRCGSLRILSLGCKL